jgi:hypothetical protein
VSELKPIRLYKFYPADAGLRNLLQGRLKVSLLKELNDPFESNPFRLATAEDRQIWEKTKDQLWSGKGIVSFSAKATNPLMWANYAENHRGLCLGFDVQGASKINYVSARKKMPALLDIVQNSDTITIEKAIMTKYSHWRYEEEWRLIVGTENRDESLGMSFIDFDENLVLREVLVGFRSYLRLKDVRKAAGNDVSIRSTRPAFNSFRVIPGAKLVKKKRT